MCRLCVALFFRVCYEHRTGTVKSRGSDAFTVVRMFFFPPPSMTSEFDVVSIMSPFV
jgi:hypothetical protein